MIYDMFDFLKKPKEYISCEWLEYGMHFSPLGIEYCCMYVPKDSDYIPVTKLKKWKYDLKDFLKKRKNNLKLHKKGIINSKCVGCYNLRKQIWISSDKIKHLVVNLNYKCNADCIYCFTHRNKRLFNRLRNIPILNILEKLVKTKKINNETEIHIGGGEPLLHDEFDGIMNLFLNNGCSKIKIYSSGVEYSESIEKALKQDSCEVIISPDCADKELYKKIKNIDKYDELWANIKKYCEMQNYNKQAVCLKYIIIPNVNDTKEELDKFFDKIITVSAKTFIIDIERDWYKKEGKDSNKLVNILKLMKYSEYRAKELGLKHIYYPASVYAIESNSELYENIDRNEK